MPRVWFIRHGESVSNANLPTNHPADSELTSRGQEEAAMIGRAFNEAPDLIVVSPYVRARETAVPTQNQFPQVPVEEWPVYEFTYLHPQRYLGTTGSQRAAWAQAYWERNDPYEKEEGEGESFAELLTRVERTKARLQAHPPAFIAIFSHGLFLRALLWTLIIGKPEASPEMMRRYHNFIWGVWMPNGALFEAVIDASERISFTGFATSHMPVS